MFYAFRKSIVFAICFVVVVAGIVSVFTGDFVAAVVVVSRLFSRDSLCDLLILCSRLHLKCLK